MDRLILGYWLLVTCWVWGRCMYASRGRGWHVQIAWNFTIGTILVLLVVSLLVLIEMLLSWLVLEMRLILAKNFHHVLDCVELLLHNSIEFL